MKFCNLDYYTVWIFPFFWKQGEASYAVCHPKSHNVEHLHIRSILRLNEFSGFFETCLSLLQVLQKSVKKIIICDNLYIYFMTIVTSKPKTADLTQFAYHKIHKRLRIQPVFHWWISISDTHLWSWKCCSNVLNVLTITFSEAACKE